MDYEMRFGENSAGYWIPHQQIAAAPTNTVAAKKIGHAHFIQNKKQLPFLRIDKTKLQSDKRGLKYAGPN